MNNRMSNEKDLVALGNRVRKLRQAINLSQESFSTKAGLHRTYISELEKGLRNPTVSTLNKIANALNIDMKDLWEK